MTSCQPTTTTTTTTRKRKQADSLIAVDGSKQARTQKWPAWLATPRCRARCAMWAKSLRETDEFKADASYLPGRDWVMSEKMDGQYMYWPGYGKQLYARGRGGRGDANAQNPPPEFVARLPKGIALEGELAHLSGVASRGGQCKKDGWRDACFWVFDAPELAGTFTQRLAHLKSLEGAWSKRYCRVVPQLGVATSSAVLGATLRAVVARGGEGLMLRDPAARYEFVDPHSTGPKVTTRMYKYKPFDDVECRVLGRNQSGCRGYQCVLPNGVEFGLSSFAGVKCGKAGTIVNITCQGYLANGKPQYPKAVGVRRDRPWEDYVAAWKLREEAPATVTLPATSAPSAPVVDECDVGEAAKPAAESPCKFGASCYRTSREHLQLYTHAGVTIAV